MMPRRVLCLLLLLPLATAALGATITVRKDGTGDYSVIQQALDAAANGDTILIGPGEYTDKKTARLPGWAWDVETYGDVLASNLVIIGAGASATFIGPISYAPFFGTESPQGLTCARLVYDLKISDLTIRNCFTGLYFLGTLSMDRCNLQNNDFGVNWATVGVGGTIRDSHFSATEAGVTSGLYTSGGGGGVLVEHCEFMGAGPYVQNPEVTFRGCRIGGSSVVGIHVDGGAHCALWDCDVFDVSIGVHTWWGSSCEIHDSRIQGTSSALTIDQRTSATVDGSSLTGGSDAVVLARDSDAITIHGCDFHKGTGPVIHSTRPFAWGAVTHDLTNNYWGTTDEAEIQSWILDSNDDPNIHATVLYTPFAGQSVPAETTTWGGLKALFR